jgi:hypothetical protein
MTPTDKLLAQKTGDRKQNSESRSQRAKLANICDNYLTVQQDILETFAAGSTFTTAELYPYVLAALQISPAQYSPASLRYDLSKLRAKALVQRLPKSRRYRLWPQGYSICLVFLKPFERVYAPLTAGLLQPLRADSKLQQRKRTQLDRLFSLLNQRGWNCLGVS